MKKLGLTTVLVVFLMILSKGIQGQTAQPKLDQVNLIQQFLGTWQTKLTKDTVTVWEFQKFGNAIVANLYNVIKNQKTPYAIVCYGFDSKIDKFKGYSLFADKSYGTWIASFTSQKTFHVESMQDFNPEIIDQRIDCVFNNQDQWTMTMFNKDGVKLSEEILLKAK